MSRKKLPDTVRIAIWRAHSQKCIYCGDPLPFGELDIDILPEDLGRRLEEFAQFKSDLGLEPSFNLNSIGNLVPAHRRCNQAKSNIRFQQSRATFFLEIAAAKEASVLRYAAAAKLRDQKEQLLERVRLAIEAGTFTASELFDVRSAPPASFPLSSSITFTDGPEEKIQQDEIENLLDKPVLFGGVADIDGIDFVHANGSTMRIRTCREYGIALAEGYYAPTTLAMKMEAFIAPPHAVLRAIASIQQPLISHVRSPFAGVADLQLLPKDVLPRLGPGDDQTIADIHEQTLDQLAESAKLVIVSVSSTRLRFEWEFAGVVLTELIRGDLDGDGVEEILVQHYTYAIEGSIGCGSIGLLRRSGPNDLFEYFPNWR